MSNTGSFSIESDPKWSDLPNHWDNYGQAGKVKQHKMDFQEQSIIWLYRQLKIMYVFKQTYAVSQI